MMNYSNNTHTSANYETHGRNSMVNFNDFSDSESSNQPNFAPLALQAVDLKNSSAELTFFTPTAEKVFFHYVNGHGYLQCNGPDCPMCRAQIKLDSRYLFPVYDHIEGEVKVLAVPPSEKPKSLFPQIKPYVTKGGQLVSIEKNGFNYDVYATALPEYATIDQDKITAFSDAFDSGEIRLSDIYRILTDDELREIPEIERRLRFKGVA
ncbi:hypothetical protein [Vibrio sp. V12_P9A6T4]|uniref:hypothetical protein n=2 Tax=Vibrio sp. V12_P9A6T4 TaxID=1938667 RepID=UPI0011404108